MGDNAIQIPGYNIARKDRVIGQHGGVCLYINVKIPYEVLNQYHHPLLEVPWVKTRPHRLPRGLSCIIVGSIYHPPSAHAETMINYLLEQLASIESTYLNCGFMILGDFNNLNISRIKNQFRLKQLHDSVSYKRKSDLRSHFDQFGTVLPTPRETIAIWPLRPFHGAYRT